MLPKTTSKCLLLLKKDFMNLKKNSEIMAVCLIPLLLVAFYKGDIENPITLLVISSLFNISMIPCMLMASQIAQEKELRTLYTLRTNGITFFEFLLSKIVFMLVFYLSISAIIFLFTQETISGLFLYMIVSVICVIPVAIIGAIIGIVSENQMSANMSMLPVMIIFMLPTFIDLITNSFLNTIVLNIPTNAYQSLIISFVFGQSSQLSNVYAVMLLLVFTIVMLLVFLAVYKKLSFRRITKKVLI